MDSEGRLLRALARRAGIDHDLPIPTPLKVLVLFWFLMGATDIVRGLPDRSGSDSALWLLPGVFNLYVCYKLLALRRSWRKVALVYNWTFMGLALAAAMVLCNALFEPAAEGSVLHRLLIDSVLGPTATLGAYLAMAAAVFGLCLWQNTVLSSSGIRKLFDSATAAPG